MEKTVVKAFTVLEVLARSERPRGVTELAVETNLSKSNVHRLVNTLIGLRYVKQDPVERKYSCTLRLWEMANPLIGRLDLRKVAAPFMREMAQHTGETVHLSVLEGGEVVYIDKIESLAHPVRAYTQIGGRAPAQCVATGKALLAYATDESLKSITEHLAAYTPHSITDPRVLKAELQTVRARGYAINHGEWKQTVRGIGAPVRDLSGQVVAAIGISGPADRLSEASIEEIGPTLHRTAIGLSRELGYMEDHPSQFEPADSHRVPIR